MIADDFLVVGCGDTIEEATIDHDKKLRSFLRKCTKEKIHLNIEKIKLREKKVTYIGHTLSAEGVTPGEDKVKSIIQMPTPQDVTGIKRFLGMIQYIDKFIKNLRTRTENMRRLTRKDVPWNWTEKEEAEMKDLKKAITSTPTIRYYDVSKDVLIQCDASKCGLGVVLLQEGKPIAYASKALTETEIRYAQIEKEMLAIVFACNKFRQYI